MLICIIATNLTTVPDHKQLFPCGNFVIATAQTRQRYIHTIVPAIDGVILGNTIA